ncbi:ABC transporter substrate-binding protein [Nocardiopsis dassonvillei]|jgi:peptide/nickel transport system substrate-binding protein|uniref:ABC transporter substrate-binding protein n=1 Tax=Nocardiopsis dassonvillei TaxID=2014 RepID=UPI00102C0ED7|nr:ABC transporter substrate-binding protein [Nocardiopsis dassonvillei]MCP3014059.1 ABC transporter substrate-binding protein [Nocardiopsis dassonvillei]
MFRKPFRKPLALLASAAALTLVATACAESNREGGGADASAPFVFASAGDIKTLDPFLTSDGETFRYSRQVFETLLEHESGGTEIVGGLAEDWEQSEDGTVWTFHLRDGVLFHDGDEFNAEAVCANFDRWYNLTGGFQSSNNSYYWQSIFGGFAENESEDLAESRYVSCEATDELTAVITIDEYSSIFPGGFSLASFGIMSPSTLEAIADAEITGEEGNFTLPEYTQTAGTLAGTGPFTVQEWDHDQAEVTLQRFDDYWGEAAGFETMILRAIPDETARRQALEAGDIHGYDLVAPADVAPLTEAGFQVPTRGVFNVLYMAYQQEASEALADLEVRQALAHAVDRQRIVDTILPEGGEVATQFHPNTLDGWSPDVQTYEYDPELAKEMLADAGQEDLTLEFCYPTDVTRPYMPAPRDIFDVIAADLEAVGVTVEPVTYEWTEYVPRTNSGECPLYLLGWTGDYNDAYNFVGTWFSQYNSEFGFRDEDLFEAMEEASTNPDQEERVAAYQDLNNQIMDILPGLPISSSPPSIAFSADVNPPNVSPLTQEQFAEASWK